MSERSIVIAARKLIASSGVSSEVAELISDLVEALVAADKHDDAVMAHAERELKRENERCARLVENWERFFALVAPENRFAIEKTCRVLAEEIRRGEEGCYEKGKTGEDEGQEHPRHDR